VSLWDWAQAAYERPGVAEAALALQDLHGQSVSFLLWAAWARPDAALAGRGAEVARAWNRAAIAPLREARRALKPACPPVDDSDREALRDHVRAAELEAERVLLATLERLSLPGDAALVLTLAAASAAWGPAAPDDALAAFAAALG
jgi:uncharacterized protein (TIGR02444 family)